VDGQGTDAMAQIDRQAAFSGRRKMSES